MKARDGRAESANLVRPESFSISTLLVSLISKLSFDVFDGALFWCFLKQSISSRGSGVNSISNISDHYKRQLWTGEVYLSTHAKRWLAVDEPIVAAPRAAAGLQIAGLSEWGRTRAPL